MAFVKPAFVTDADTLLAYRMNESATNGWTTAANSLIDDKGTYHGTPAGVSPYPGIRNFNSVVNRWCRYWDGTSNYFNRANASAMTTMWQGEWTIEAWIKLDSIASTQTIISYAASGESAATNYQTRLQINTSGLMTMFWEYGGAAATNMSITAVSGALSINTVYHVACRKKLVSGSYVVSFWVNGVKVDEQTAAANADGGTSCTLGIGIDIGANAAQFLGFMRSLRVSNSALADATILSDASDSTQMHATDAGTFAHWKMTEQPEFVDDGPFGVHMRGNSSPTRINAIVNDAGGATGAKSFASSQWGTSDFPRSDVASQLLGEVTLRFAVMIPSANAANHGLLCWGAAGFETDETRNYLFEVDISSSRVLSFGWERLAGSGTSVTYTMPYHGGVYIIHCIRRIDPDNSGKYIGEIWVDGERQVSTNNLTGPSGGSNSIPLIGTFSGSTNANTLVLDDFHVQKRALTEFEIKTDAGVLAVANALDTSPPVLSANSPANGATLTVNQSIAVDVTDAGAAGLARTILVAEFSDGGPPEVIRKESAYQTGWSGSTSSITNGTRYTFTRTAGWRSTPTIKLYSRDGLNNEGNFVSSLAYVYAADTAAPTMAANTPSNGATLTTTTQDVSVDVTDASTISRIILKASYSDGGVEEVVYDGAAYATGYSGSTSSISGGTRFTFHRTAGWRSTPTIKLQSRDSLNNEANFVSSLAYVFSADTTAPTIAAHGPPNAGATLSTSTTDVVVDVTDSSTISKTILVASFGDGKPPELVFNGSAFVTGYSGSTSSITNGTRYTVHRTAGWRTDPTILLYARDSLTNENSFSGSVAYVFTPDATGPSLAGHSPSPGSTLSTSTSAVQLDVTDVSGLATYVVAALYDDGTEEIVYSGGFTDAYTGSTSSITNGTRLQFYRAEGWKENPSFLLYATDSLGNATNGGTPVDYLFTPTPADSSAPAIANISPADGSTITRVTPIQFDVTDASSMPVVIVVAKYPSQLWEVVHDGVSFAPNYANSTRNAISGGFRFVLSRLGGWPGSPTFDVRASDIYGNAVI